MKNISGDNLQRIARELIDFNKLSAQLAAKEIRERHRRAGIVFFRFRTLEYLWPTRRQ